MLFRSAGAAENIGKLLARPSLVETATMTGLPFRRWDFAAMVTGVSSSAASISSITQKGVGWIFKIEKYRAMATNAFSPPDSRVMTFSAFPGG